MNQREQDDTNARASRSRGTTSRDRKPAVALSLVGLVIVVAGVFFAGRSGNDPQAYSNDFNVFYHAAREVVAGRDPYQNSLGEWTPYLYLPLLAVVLAPLAVLPLPVAAYIWFLINAASTVAGAWIPARLACDSGRLPDSSEDAMEAGIFSPKRDFVLHFVTTVSLLVVARFVLDNFNLGQVNPVVAGLAAAHIWLYSNNRKTASAFALAIAASIKLTPLVLIAYHVARRRWNFAAVCLGVFVGVTALSFVPLGSDAPAAFHEFVSRTIKNEQGYDLAYPGNQSLRGAVERMTSASTVETDQEAFEASRRPSNPVAVLISLVLLSVAMLVASRAPTELLAAAPFVCCFVLVSPLSWKAHFVVLIVPVACLVAEALRASGIRRAALSVVLAVMFVLFNLTSPRLIGLRAAEWADAHSLVFLGGMLTFAASVCVARFARTKGTRLLD